MKTRSERMADVVTMLAEAWRQKITGATMMTYSAGMEDIQIEAVERAAMAAIRSCQFMPSVFELRQLCGCKSGVIAAKDRPTLAWEAVRRAVARVGGYKSVKFDDVVIHATIRSMGGWVALCDSTSDEMVWREKDFLRTYSAMMNLPLGSEQNERLGGIIERENGPVFPVELVKVGCLTAGTSGEVRITEEPKETKRIEGPRPAAELLSKKLACDDRKEITRLPMRSREEQIRLLSEMTK